MNNRMSGLVCLKINVAISLLLPFYLVTPMPDFLNAFVKSSDFTNG